MKPDRIKPGQIWFPDYPKMYVVLRSHECREDIWDVAEFTFYPGYGYGGATDTERVFTSSDLMELDCAFCLDSLRPPVQNTEIREKK